MRNSIFIFLLWICAALASPPLTVRYEQKLGETLPAHFVFINENGKPTPLSSLFTGRPHLLVFAYYQCPNLCTLVLNGLVQSMREIKLRLGKDYDVITVSINPSEKSALAQMKRRTYLSRYGEPSSDGWRFLVGDEPSIQALTQAAGFHYERDALSGEYNHPSGLIVLTPDGKISRYFFGIQFDSHELAKAINQARFGKKGSLIEEVLLYCFHYDPASTKNGQNVLAAIRLIGLITVFAIMGLIVRLSLPRSHLK